MKYIKEFESNKDNYFWKVMVNKPYLEASLIKLNIPRHVIDVFLLNENLKGERKVYVSSDTSSYPYLSWNYTITDMYGFKNYGYIYKGEIKLTLEEANMIIMSSKYNL